MSFETIDERTNIWTQSVKSYCPVVSTCIHKYTALCFMLDVLFDGRPIQRFWFLETVARMPCECNVADCLSMDFKESNVGTFYRPILEN